MTPCRLFGVLLTAAIAAAVTNADSPARPLADPPSRFEFTERHMGTEFRIVFYAADESAANGTARAAFARIEKLNSIMSDYDPQSELMRLCRTAGQGQAVPASDELFFVLVRAVEMSQRTEGAFDVTVGPLVRLWRRARRQHELPDPGRVAEARERVGYQYMRLDAEARTVELLKAGMRLDLGAIAKGYAADEALAVLRRHGIGSAMVDAGGDIVVADPPLADQPGWRIATDAGRGRLTEAAHNADAARDQGLGVRGQASNRQLLSPDPRPLTPNADPRSLIPEPSAFRVLLLRNAAVATSGDAFQYVEIDGVRYSHIIDPRTGLGLTDPSTVTVIAADGITADSLASAVSVLGPERGLELIETTPSTAALIVRARQGKIEILRSRLFQRFQIE